MLVLTTQQKSRPTDVVYLKTHFHHIRVHRYAISYHWIAKTWLCLLHKISFTSSHKETRYFLLHMRSIGKRVMFWFSEMSVLVWKLTFVTVKPYLTLVIVIPVTSLWLYRKKKTKKIFKMIIHTIERELVQKSLCFLWLTCKDSSEMNL